MNEAIKRAGNASGLQVIDAGNEPGITKVIERHEHKFLADGLHSNEAGKAIQGRYMASAINRLIR